MSGGRRRPCLECDGDGLVVAVLLYDERCGAIVHETAPCQGCDGAGFIVLPSRQLERGGILIVLLVMAATLIALYLLAAPRSGQTTALVDVSEISSTAQSGAPRPTPDVIPADAPPIGVTGSSGNLPWSAGTPQHSGWATWYDDGPGLYGAVPSWHFGDEPYTVQVTAFEGGQAQSIFVTIRDFCACGDRGEIPTVIDLSPAAFRELAPLSAGVIRVVVDGVPHAPATDR
jgi:hypothetical protein